MTNLQISFFKNIRPIGETGLELHQAAKIDRKTLDLHQNRQAALD
jgi:hypothetical protein